MTGMWKGRVHMNLAIGRDFRKYVLSNYRHTRKMRRYNDDGTIAWIWPCWHIYKRPRHKHMAWDTLCGIRCGYKGGVLRNKYKNIRMVESDSPICKRCRNIAFSKFRKELKE